ncbi:MAG TPA: M64 family metallopeptidase, partial [Pirellulaceae bacterium]
MVPIAGKLGRWGVLLGIIGCPMGTLIAQSYQTMVSNGPSANRVDIVFVGDGYTSAEVGTLYPQHVQSQLNHMFGGSQAPFPRYSKFFNAHRVNVVSQQSGADKPPEGIFVNTALDASYWWDGTTERLLYFSNTKAQTAVTTALAGTGIDVDMRYGTVNDTKYGGGGGTWAVYAGGNSSALEVALHELGHSFAGLADEYFSSSPAYTGPELSEPNVTNSPSSGKWDRWVGYNDPTTSIGPIGYYEGGRYYQFGIYRPSVNSKMRNLNRPFDAISREQFVARIYAEVNPLDSWLANGATLQDPPSLWVDSIDPDVIEVEWFLNGQSLDVFGENLSIMSLGALGIGPGTY